MPDAPHSAEYLGDYRDFWWNADFLALIARRWQLDAVTHALDVGCGRVPLVAAPRPSTTVPAQAATSGSSHGY